MADVKKPVFMFQDPYPLGPDKTEYRLLSKEYVSIASFEGKDVLKVDPEGLTILVNPAMRDVSFLLRLDHLEQVAAILADKEASPNDRGVAIAMRQNAEVASKFELLLCQDTGTATVIGKKWQQVWTGVNDEEYITKGIFKTYTEENLRYSQTTALNMYDEVNSGNNMPPQIDISAVDGMSYKFLFLAKGGGSANKTMLYQETKALLNPASLEKFLVKKLKSLGTAACPAYHIAFAIGGPAALLAEENIKKVECIDYPELGMEAVWKIEVVDFPAFILVDDKGNDFYRQIC